MCVELLTMKALLVSAGLVCQADKDSKKIASTTVAY